METILKVDNIEKYYGNKRNLVKAIDGISFCVERGEYIGIMGASGSGKTTLLNCISTIDTVTSGHIYVRGEDITAMSSNKLSHFRRYELGFVFQDFNLLDTLTGYENIVLALSIARTPAGKIQERVTSISEKLEISEVLNKYPYQMSGGQKQRVAIAGVVAMHPKCIVLDEPTAMLDPNGRKEVIRTVRALNQVEDVTVLLITHYMEEVIYADKVIVMDDGKIVMQGTPREIFSQVDTLKKYGLDVPQVTMLAHELRKEGLAIPEGILSVEELVDQLCR